MSTQNPQDPVDEARAREKESADAHEDDDASFGRQDPPQAPTEPGEGPEGRVK